VSDANIHTQTLKSNQWLAKRPKPNEEAHALSISRRCSRAPSACQPAGIFLLSSLHLVEILFCILLRVIITRQALSPRSLKVADLTLTCAEFLFRRNITFFRRRTERNAKLCVKMQMTSRRNAKKAQSRHWAACAMVDHSTHFKTH
jgi:hypothetical protein